MGHGEQDCQVVVLQRNGFVVDAIQIQIFQKLGLLMKGDEFYCLKLTVLIGRHANAIHRENHFER